MMQLRFGLAHATLCLCGGEQLDEVMCSEGPRLEGCKHQEIQNDDDNNNHINSACMYALPS